MNTLRLQNFRCFESLDIDFHPQLTVLVGINGAGKTAVLDSVAIMLSSIIKQFNGSSRGFNESDVRETPHDLDSVHGVARMQLEYPVKAEVKATLAGQPTYWNRARHSKGGRTTWADSSAISTITSAVLEDSSRGTEQAPLLPVIALYGVERLLGIRRAAGVISRDRTGAYDSALDSKSDLSRLSTYIKALTMAKILQQEKGVDAAAARNQLEAISTACNILLESTGWKNPEWSPLLEEIALTHDQRGTLPLSYLSSGIKISVGVIIDLASRAARANPTVGASELLNLVPGIVLIDEIDLHLHPTWQQRILPQLQKIFPNIQFIVTTHSPQVLSTAGAENIRIIEGDLVRRVEHSAGLRSDIVLAKVLGTDPEPELEINRKLAEYMKMVDSRRGESREARALRDLLDDELGGVSNVPKLADADAEIAFYDLESY